MKVWFFWGGISLYCFEESLAPPRIPLLPHWSFMDMVLMTSICFEDTSKKFVFHYFNMYM